MAKKPAASDEKPPPVKIRAVREDDRLRLLQLDNDNMTYAKSLRAIQVGCSINT